MKSAIIATLVVLSQLPAHAQKFTPIPTTVMDGKKCSLVWGGVKCPGEGPKCVAPCQIQDSHKGRLSFVRIGIGWLLKCQGAPAS